MWQLILAFLWDILTHIDYMYKEFNFLTDLSLMVWNWQNLNHFAFSLPHLQLLYFVILFFVNMNIDLVFNAHHFQQIQNYLFVPSDCLFDSFMFLFHYSQTSLKPETQCIAHFLWSFWTKFKKWLIFISKILLLSEDHGRIFLEIYVEKMAINEKIGALWGYNCTICYSTNYLHRPIHMWCNMFMSKSWFHNQYCIPIILPQWNA
jgi:hypothetical protein